MHVIKKILVPIDFSPLSDNALSTAIAICKRQLATLTLLHVVEDSDAVPDQKLREAMDMLNIQAREFRLREDLVINHVVCTGDPSEEICLHAKNEAFDLIVMGKHSALAREREIFGSTVWKVVWNAPCPVMTIPGNQQWFAFKKILFPVRLIPHALDKYDYTRAIILKNKSTLLMTGLVNTSGFHPVVKMKNLLEIMHYKMDADDVDYRTLIQQADNISNELLRLSNTEQPDLIVITATMETPIKEFFHGPFTRQIIDQARFPVLSIRPFSSLGAWQGTPGSQPPISII